MGETAVGQQVQNQNKQQEDKIICLFLNKEIVEDKGIENRIKFILCDSKINPEKKFVEWTICATKKIILLGYSTYTFNLKIQIEYILYQNKWCKISDDNFERIVEIFNQNENPKCFYKNNAFISEELKRIQGCKKILVERIPPSNFQHFYYENEEYIKLFKEYFKKHVVRTEHSEGIYTSVLIDDFHETLDPTPDKNNTKIRGIVMTYLQINNYKIVKKSKEYKILDVKYKR